MKRENAQLFDFARSHSFETCELVREYVEKATNAQDSLLELVYQIDERTGLPTGDLQYLVSDKANPQVKEFILANLMQDVSAAKNVAATYKMSDDDILALSMNKGESVEDYVARLNSSIERDVWMINEFNKPVDVPSRSEEPPVSSE